MVGKLEILVVSTDEEIQLYKDAYPGLLENVFLVVLAHEYRQIQGLRFTRAFVTESVSEDSEIIGTITHGLMLQLKGNRDEHPIYLRMDWRRYGWDYKDLLKKYMLSITEAGEVTWELGELDELKRLAAE